eukprot:CCRYP_001431-RA/>CCRYP_001431-RA protein AED:0.11 eAED:0.11 QI:395/1/1/1/0/0/4/30/130
MMRALQFSVVLLAHSFRPLRKLYCCAMIMPTIYITAWSSNSLCANSSCSSVSHLVVCSRLRSSRNTSATARLTCIFPSRSCLHWDLIPIHFQTLHCQPPHRIPKALPWYHFQFQIGHRPHPLHDPHSDKF